MINQLPTIPPIVDQSTEPGPIVIQAKPIKAPMMVWVPETGQPILVAINNQAPEAKRAESIPNAKRSGDSIN